MEKKVDEIDQNRIIDVVALVMMVLNLVKLDSSPSPPNFGSGRDIIKTRLKQNF